MGRGISIDKEVKEYYYFLKDFKCEDKNKLDDVYSYTKDIVEKYLTQREEIFLEILEIIHIKKEDVADMIFKDAWYHIYENICFLDIRYNIDEDIETIKYNHEVDVDSNNDYIDIVSLKDYLQVKGYDNNQKRRYKYRISNVGEYMDYLDNYKIPKICSVYTDYYLVYSETNQKHYLCKQYTDIADFFYEEKINKTDIKAKIRNYTIWDIDTDWLPVIDELYTLIQNGNQNIFQFQLVERLFKFRTLLHIYNNFSTEGYVEDMLFDVQPFTVFGYSVCMNFLMERYNKIRQHDNEEEYAEFFFNGITYTIRMVLGKVLTTIWKEKTNQEKQRFIRKLKNKCSEKENVLYEFLKFFKDYNYNISYFSSKESKDVINMYVNLLFSDEFISRRYIALSLFINEEDSDNTWKADLYNGDIEGFSDSISVEPTSKKEYESWIEEYFNNEILTYDFNFSDLLYLVTEYKYNNFYLEEEENDN